MTKLSRLELTFAWIWYCAYWLGVFSWGTRAFALERLYSLMCHEISYIPTWKFWALKGIQWWIATIDDRKLCQKCGWVMGDISHGEYACSFKWRGHVRGLTNSQLLAEYKLAPTVVEWDDVEVCHVKTRLQYWIWAHMVFMECARHGLPL